MSFRKKLPFSGLTPAASQHSHTDTGDLNSVSDHQSQQPPFLTLEETTDIAGSDDRARKRALQSTQQQEQSLLNDEDQRIDEEDGNEKNRKNHSTISMRKRSSSSGISFKTILSYSIFILIFLIIWDAIFTPPEKRWIQPAHTDFFLKWVQQHPIQGLFAITVVIAAAVVVLIPIGTPLTLGCGYIYKGAYGWKIGLTLATLVSMGGSALGAVTCFLLGRYLFRDQVRQWARNKYPLFDAIDTAASEHGLRIMAMLYLTPILPLGPVSYMCGTTSMALSSFVMAKIASLPLMLLYCFIGASARTLISSGPAQGQGQDGGTSNDFKSIEENEVLIASGILMSFVMIAGITSYIKKELHNILEKQGKHKPGEKADVSKSGITTGSGSDQSNNNASVSSGNNNINIDDNHDDGIEMGHSIRNTTRRRAN